MDEIIYIHTDMITGTTTSTVTDITPSVEFNAMYSMGSIEWFIEQLGKEPMILFSYRGDSRTHTKHVLSLVNSYFDEFTEFGYKIYGFSYQSKEQIEVENKALLLKFDTFCCSDNSLVNYLKENNYINIQVSESNDFSWGKTIEPSFLVIRKGCVLYSWTTSMNPPDCSNSTISSDSNRIRSSKSMNLRPRIIRILEIIKGKSYQVDHPTPVNSDESMFQCALRSPFDQLLTQQYNLSLCSFDLFPFELPYPSNIKTNE